MPTNISYLKNPDGTPGETWNMVLGCDHRSKGCKFCWAEGVSHAHANHPNAKISDAYSGVTFEGKWTGVVKCLKDRLDIPLHWRKPRTVGVSFTGDLFHDKVPSFFIDKVFAVMALCPQHTFIIPTKRYKRAHEYIDQRRINYHGSPRKGSTKTYKSSCDWVYRQAREMKPDAPPMNLVWPLPNVWLMPSVSNQADADVALPLLMQTNVAKRLVSFEPAIETVDFKPYFARDLWYIAQCGGCGYLASSEYFNGDDESIGCPKCHSDDIMDVSAEYGLDGIVMGGESATGFRPMDLQWARDVRDDCKEAGVPFYFKQVAGRGPIPEDLMVREWPS